MPKARAAGAALLAGLLILLLSPVSAAAAPDEVALPRVMSTNLCADALLLGLADPAQIVSVSRKSQDPLRSSQAELAQRFPANDGSAEEVIALRPDVVLASRRWQARHQVSLLSAHGIRIVTVTTPRDWTEIWASTREIAAHIGRAEAGEAIIAATQARIASLPHPLQPARALYLRPNGGSAGAGTHVDAVLQAAGLRNHAAESGHRGWGRIALENVVANPPDLFVLSSMVNDGGHARSNYARHPLMRALLAQRPAVQLEGNDWGCSNYQLARAAEHISAELVRLALAGPQARQ